MKEADNNLLEMADFSAIEDSKGSFEIIRYLAKNAGKNASAEALAEGISRVYISNNKTLVKIAPNGVVTELIPSLNIQKPYFIKYKPLTVLYASKK